MKKPGEEPPVSMPHYIVARNGIFLKKENWWMEAVVPVKQIAVLEEQSLYCKFKFPALSSIVLKKAWEFFKRIYLLHGSESAVLLHYCDELGWEITIPEQTVSFAHVKYKSDDRLDGYQLMGTMHSHSSMGAFHSGTDIGDEAVMDGIHITFGNVDIVDSFSMDAEVVINGTRFKLPLDWMEGVYEMERIFKKPLPKLPATSRFSVNCIELENWEVPEEWINRVTALPPEPLPILPWRPIIKTPLATDWALGDEGILERIANNLTL